MYFRNSYPKTAQEEVKVFFFVCISILRIKTLQICCSYKIEAFKTQKNQNEDFF